MHGSASMLPVHVKLCYKIFKETKLMFSLKAAMLKQKRYQDLLKKATPMFLHLLMICSVGVYAVLGALVMRKLETRTITEIRQEVNESRSLDFNSDAGVERRLEVGREQNRRRRHNNTAYVGVAIERTTNSKWRKREQRTAAEVVRSRKCAINVIKRHGFTKTDCKIEQLDEILVSELDKCYYVSTDREMPTNDLVFRNSDESADTVEEHEKIEIWSFVDSLLFAFTVITTIGYGNVAPRTIEGRFFVIGYGLIGIPFTLLVIADLGKFLSELMTKCSKIVGKIKKRLQGEWQTGTRLKRSRCHSSRKATDKHRKMLEKSQSQEDIIDLEDGKEKLDDISDSEDGEENSQAFLLFILFIIYTVLGGLMLSSYEPEMDFFKAVYFNFVSLTSIGLGDIVPKSETYMVLTIVYITIGLALTTIAIEIAADTLKRVHYFGRKIENVGNVAIWFGGKKITMKALVKNLGDHFNLPTTVMKDLDLDHFVDQAIKVEEGEIETLRPPPFMPDSATLERAAFVDEPEEEVWKCNSTPPSITALPSLPQSPTSSSLSEYSTIPTPPTLRTPSPVPTPQSSPQEATPPPSPTSTPTPPRDPTPIREPEREPSPESEPEPSPEPQPLVEIEVEPKPEPPQFTY
ncbi:Potassium channel sub K member 18, variant 2 [Parelaphostrongylus tenuis]|uniref:Potassium channel sub K member 18, variant 2 n=1 Tax=Parelaphostrongylus tenuis TaxID=148309 RepID=A0AAD5QWA8_PARTN|nr:Potassium channel sub K member 18, variant 2 [Parelaphostrongylus tenuis]